MYILNNVGTVIVQGDNREILLSIMGSRWPVIADHV